MRDARFVFELTRLIHFILFDRTKVAFCSNLKSVGPMGASNKRQNYQGSLIVNIPGEFINCTPLDFTI